MRPTAEDVADRDAGAPGQVVRTRATTPITTRMTEKTVVAPR